MNRSIKKAFAIASIVIFIPINGWASSCAPGETTAVEWTLLDMSGVGLCGEGSWLRMERWCQNGVRYGSIQKHCTPQVNNTAG